MKEGSKVSEQYLFEQILWIIGQGTTMKKKVTWFPKNYVISFSKLLGKVRTICEFRFNVYIRPFTEAAIQSFS